MTKPKQPELPKMPGKTKSQLRAEEYVAALDEVDVKKEAAAQRQVRLINQLKDDRQGKVVCTDATGNKRTFILETLEKLKAKKGH